MFRFVDREKNTDMTDFLCRDITEVLKAYYKVYNALGFGFLEKVYENAMLIELMEMDLYCEQQKTVKVYYKGKIVGHYCADLLIERKVMVELKSAEALSEANERQLTNYLKATDLEIGLLLNFGKKPAFSRQIFTNDKKIRNNPLNP